MRFRDATDIVDQCEQRIASELATLAVELERLGATLCADLAVSRAYGAQLQAIDLVAQKQRCLAAVLGSSDRRAAIEAIGVDELKAALGDGGLPNRANESSEPRSSGDLSTEWEF